MRKASQTYCMNGTKTIRGQHIKRSALSFLVLSTLVSCATVGQQRQSIESDIAEIYSSYSNEIRQFFIEEAIQAGVEKIRPLNPEDIPPRANPNEISGCAYAFVDRKLIVIEIEKPLCVKIDHLAHEISHIGSNCSGHNDIFYKYNFAVAKRYEERFPNAAKRKWFAPVQSVASVSAIYRSDEC